ncbi:MAG: UxaA family hydrolase, partial [Devosiaceae bacterium]|nr:UxaA family hydrolase [Devosiaceae bacterium MH13]
MTPTKQAANANGAPRAIILRDGDDVAVVTAVCEPGTELLGVTVQQRLPKGHKVALRALAEGAPVLKYGQFIGRARVPIEAGDHVHTHNLAFERVQSHADGASGSAGGWRAPSKASQFAGRTFRGYARGNGKVGTRNLIAVITSVNCSATVAHLIADEAERRGLFDDLPNVDGAVALTHGTGCGMADSGPGYELLERTVWGTAANANIGGAVLVGLGCEVFQLPRLKKQYGLTEEGVFRSFTIQNQGGTMASVEAGLAAVRELAERANACERTEQPLKHLALALQCGGSDAFSGIS